jgi:hypothetical protein
MEAKVEQAANKIKRIRACINNLISVQALPAIWSGGQPPQIVGALLDMLPQMLGPDFAYVRLNDSTGGSPSRRPFRAGPKPDQCGAKDQPVILYSPESRAFRDQHFA